ncbi:DUF1853 family protein [Paraperlucidibaca sp.]|jgi:hypothetical protein|uniref:DUF1853 family protein n=1 Tax=Paraperlucidibaca sp. TaxID=2708021 RepID=UPI0030F39917
MSDFWQAFTQPAVRDLAWLIGTPPLLTPLGDTAGFSNVYWPDNAFFSELLTETMPLLQKLDREPAALIAHSENSRDYRLGCYLERLLSFWLAHPDNPRYALVAANLPIREDGITLGELDYLVRNKRDGTLTHWELAVKFYLGRSETDLDQQWLGPGLHDRLDIKRDHLCQHQLQISQKAIAREIINAHLVATAEQPLGNDEIARMCWLKGRLFAASDKQWAVVDPTQGNPEALRGHWCIDHELPKMADSRQKHGTVSANFDQPRLRGTRLYQTQWSVPSDWLNTAYSPRQR